MREQGFAGFSAKELKVIALRTNGVKPPEIAKRIGVRRTRAYTLLWSAMRKARVNDVALLTRWAMANALDELLEPERPDDLPKPEPKVYKQRIKLGRMRRALGPGTIIRSRIGRPRKDRFKVEWLWRKAGESDPTAL